MCLSMSLRGDTAEGSNEWKGSRRQREMQCEATFDICPFFSFLDCLVWDWAKDLFCMEEIIPLIAEYAALFSIQQLLIATITEEISAS